MLKLNNTIIQNCKNVLFSEIVCNKPFTIHVAGAKYYAPMKPVDTSEWPENRKLRIMEKVPLFNGKKSPKMPKMLKMLRGPEEVHTTLLYKGFGVKALLGGRMTFEMFEFLRLSINKALDTDRMFAVWRVDAPWQPVAKRSVGKRMGSGKGSIHHYVTPVRAERIIVEVGGDLHELEAKKVLSTALNGLPFPTKFVSQKELEKEKENEKWRRENNLNPYTMEYIIKNNMGGCKKWLSPYDYKYLGKYT